MNFIACHDEKIHIPGFIQDFGYLIGLDAVTKKIKFLSENLPEIFPLTFPVFGGSLDEFPEIFGPVVSSQNFRDLDCMQGSDTEVYLDKIVIGEANYHFTSFCHGDHIFLQLERELPSNELRSYVTRKYEKINSSKTEDQIWEKLLTAFNETIGYDRMMVYRFLEDGSGVVIAEKKNADIESYLHLHYPESDIPYQARELYMKKRKRILSNADSAPVAIISASEEKIDLTYSNLRAMSPIHNQYVKNSGAMSSFSTSIIVNDKLWGLVTCQNITAKHIDLHNRMRAEVFTIIAANTYTALQAQQNLILNIELDKKNAVLRHKFLQYDDLDQSLKENIEEIRKYPDADGLAIVTANEVSVTGEVPSENDIQQICHWIRNNDIENYYGTNEFQKKYFPHIQHAAGIGIAYLDGSKREILLWFRREISEEILWAGNPHKAFEAGSENGTNVLKMSPRKSFQVYTEGIKGKSAPWQTKDFIAMKKISEIILEASHNQFVKVKELLAELKEVNEELDSFSYTISHDLGTPLTVMKLNAQMLMVKNRDNADLQKKVADIITEVDGMAGMMRDVLELSRAKSKEIHLETIPTKEIIAKINGDAILSYGKPETEIIVANCPEVLADKTLLYQVFLNVITNAVKYSSHHQNPLIQINGEVRDETVVYKLSDNGIGIQAGQEDKMFKIFNRMDNARAFQGNGVGLSIVNRIMLRLGGSISYESKSGAGTTFILTFQKP